MIKLTCNHKIISFLILSVKLQNSLSNSFDYSIMSHPYILSNLLVQIFKDGKSINGHQLLMLPFSKLHHHCMNIGQPTSLYNVTSLDSTDLAASTLLFKKLIASAPFRCVYSINSLILSTVIPYSDPKRKINNIDLIDQ